MVRRDQAWSRPRLIATFSFADTALLNATTTRTAAATRGLADTRTAGADGDGPGAATVIANAADTTDAAATLDTAQRTATADNDTVETNQHHPRHRRRWRYYQRQYGSV